MQNCQCYPAGLNEPVCAYTVTGLVIILLSVGLANRKTRQRSRKAESQPG